MLRDGLVLGTARRSGPQTPRRRSRSRPRRLGGTRSCSGWSCCCRTGRRAADGSPRAFFVEAHDLGEVCGGEAVGAADAGVRDESASGPVLDPPGGTAEGFGDFLGTVETGQWGSALGAGKASHEGRGYVGVVQEGRVLTGWERALSAALGEPRHVAVVLCSSTRGETRRASAIATRSSASHRRWARSMRDSMVLDIGWPRAVTRPANCRCDKRRSVRRIPMVRAACIPAGPTSNERGACLQLKGPIAGFGNRRSSAMLRSRGAPRSGSRGTGNGLEWGVDQGSDVGCCVVASLSAARQRLADVMLLALRSGQLFGQQRIVPYGFPPARHPAPFLAAFLP